MLAFRNACQPLGIHLLRIQLITGASIGAELLPQLVHPHSVGYARPEAINPFDNRAHLVRQSIVTARGRCGWRRLRHTDCQRIIEAVRAAADRPPQNRMMTLAPVARFPYSRNATDCTPVTSKRLRQRRFLHATRSSCLTM